MEVQESLIGRIGHLVILSGTRAEGEHGVNWIRANRQRILTLLDQHGAILFRDFRIGIASLREVVIALSDSIDEFIEESSPRTALAPDVFTSTDYSSEYPIQFHNEFSYCANWPMKLFFCCLQPAARGGSTPVADCRRVLETISPATRERFIKSGVLYRRNYLPYFGVRWQQAFHTEDREQVVEYCRANGISASWDGDALRTDRRGDAVVRHPGTGEQVWFNHGFFFNVRALEPADLREALIEQGDFSTNTYFGDGSEIPEAIIEEIRRAYAMHSVEVPWKTGDLLFVDNMLCAHSRQPYMGRRQIVVSMSEASSRRHDPVETQEPVAACNSQRS